MLVDWQVNARHVVFELQPSAERIALSYDPQNPAFPTAFDTFFFRNQVFVAR